MKIIGLTGLKGSGKNTFAECLQRCCGVPSRQMAFGDALKAEVAAMLGRDVEWVEENKNVPEIRKLLQWWGTEYRREQYCSNYWVDKVHEKILIAKQDGIELAIVTDVRFWDEFEILQALGGSVVRIERPGTETDDHISEQMIYNFPVDSVVYNGGTKESLQSASWLVLTGSKEMTGVVVV